jgi:hypothetical protein
MVLPGYPRVNEINVTVPEVHNIARREFRPLHLRNGRDLRSLLAGVLWFSHSSVVTSFLPSVSSLLSISTVDWRLRKALLVKIPLLASFRNLR